MNNEKINGLLTREKQARETIKTTIGRVPILAPLVATFGIVAVLYGFEKIIDQTFLADRPLILLFSGVVILLFTGAFYEKL